MNDDGGPAFPVPNYINADGETHESKPQGMSLRAYFAGQAMQGMLAATAHPKFDVHIAPDFRGLAEYSTRAADALIAELRKEQP